MDSAPATQHPYPASLASRIQGALMGGALGDSLGYLVEFDSIEAIRARYGRAGLLDLSQAQGPVHFSDDTQLTLYTVDGLVEALEWANDGVGADANACLWLAYLRWLATQQEPVPAHAPVPQPRWIDAQAPLHHRRHPGNACLTGLATGEMGTQARPVNPDSKGCGTVMRSAPFGLIAHIPVEAAYKLSADAATLTHGHPSARQSSGAFAVLIHALAVQGLDLDAAGAAALQRATAEAHADPDLLRRLAAAIELAGSSVLEPEELTAALGEGWVAEEALAIGLYAVLATAADATSPVEHFLAAVRVAVNHDGDSDSTGSIAGNILGAYYGEDALPQAWLALSEAPGLIRAVGAELVRVTGAED